MKNVLVGQQALQEQMGRRFSVDWKSGNHRARRLVSEFIGTSGLTFFLSTGATILVAFGGGPLAPFQFAFILAAIAALWLVAAVYCLGDISSHFNPAITLAFTLRGDMGWPMAVAYICVQLVAAVTGCYGADLMFGDIVNFAPTIPQPGQLWTAVSFEAIITFGMVLLVLSMANGPKLNSSFIPLAIGAYVMSVGTMAGPYDGAGFNPARTFGPDFVRGDFSTFWVYPLGSFIGVLVAVLIARFLRGPAKAQESLAAMGVPLDQEDF